MFKKYRDREEWFSHHRKFKTFPLWYQFPTSFHQHSLENKENLLAEAQSWRKSYHTMMNNEQGRHFFSLFLAKNLADEYLLFWHAVEVSKRETDMVKLRQVVRELYAVFITPSAPLCININEKMVTVIQSKMNLEYLDLEDIFDQAQKYVDNIMKTVYYPEFLKSPVYMDLLNELNTLSV